eukprot:c39159_g1_i1 orf=128-331(+)
MILSKRVLRAGKQACFLSTMFHILQQRLLSLRARKGNERHVHVLSNRQQEKEPIFQEGEGTRERERE